MGRVIHKKEGARILMKCFTCKGTLNDKTTTFMVEINDCIIIVKKVPSQVCAQCGETSYDHSIAQQLQNITAKMRESITEIAIVNYLESVA